MEKVIDDPREFTTEELASALRSCPDCKECLLNGKDCKETELMAADRLDSQQRELIDLRARMTPTPARRDIAKEPTKDVNGGIFGKGTTIWFCPKCGIFNTPSHAFCWKCGQALSFDIPGNRAGKGAE